MSELLARQSVLPRFSRIDLSLSFPASLSLFALTLALSLSLSIAFGVPLSLGLLPFVSPPSLAEVLGFCGIISRLGVLQFATPGRYTVSGDGTGVFYPAILARLCLFAPAPALPSAGRARAARAAPADMRHPPLKLVFMQPPGIRPTAHATPPSLPIRVLGHSCNHAPWTAAVQTAQFPHSEKGPSVL